MVSVMQRFFILTLFIIQVYSKPASNIESEKEKQVTNNETKHDLKKIEASTSEIIEKIAELNKKHGYESKHQKLNVIQNSSSPRSSQDEQNPKETARSHFKFPINPFSNPILELLDSEKEANQDNAEYATYEITNRQSQDVMPSQGYEISSTNHNAEISEEDIIPGQQVKRKIVHQQTILVPNPNYGLPNPAGYQYPLPINAPPNFSNNFIKPISDSTSGEKNYLNNLEKQTVSNIRNIISNSQISQNQAYPTYYNPQLQVPGSPQTPGTYGYVLPIKNSVGQEVPSSIGQISSNGNNYNIYGPFQGSMPESARQNWNWPGADYFPIFVRDPFLQMYNAITTMVEYGPNAGNQNPCAPAGNRKPSQNKIKNDILREGKTTVDDTKISVELDGTSSSPQISINADNRNGTYLDIENIDIGANGDNSLKFTLNLKKEEREVKEDIGTGRTTWDKIKVTGKSNSLTLHPSLNSSSRFSSKFSDFQKDLRPLTVIKNQVPGKPAASSILSPPSRDPTHQTEEYGDESEEEKSEEISSDNNKKLFSRDNTGSGVFIHRLKVRKGGVAIAGPGGIATAGSGGTAIVGPGGVAYTQPDSLAIAGSGTKVVAVDPAVNLGDLANSTSLFNRGKDPAFPPTRFGKVVAVGPVVYYNKG